MPFSLKFLTLKFYISNTFFFLKPEASKFQYSIFDVYFSLEEKYDFQYTPIQQTKNFGRRKKNEKNIDDKFRAILLRYAITFIKLNWCVCWQILLRVRLYRSIDFRYAFLNLNFDLKVGKVLIFKIQYYLILSNIVLELIIRWT